MLESGDTVVYLTHGVGTVRGRESRQVGDRDREFVVVELPNRGMTVAVPVDGDVGVGLRPVMSADDAERVMDVLRAAPERIGSTWSQRVAKCQARLKSGDPCEVHGPEIPVIWAVNGAFGLSRRAPARSDPSDNN